MPIIELLFIWKMGCYKDEMKSLSSMAFGQEKSLLKVSPPLLPPERG